MKKLKYSEVVKLFDSNGLKIIGNYVNANEYVLCERKDGIWCYASYSNLKAGKSPIIWGKYNYSNLEHNIRVLLSKYAPTTEFVSWSTGRNGCAIIELRCGCGNIFRKKVYEISCRNRFVCVSCATKGRASKRQKRIYGEIISEHGYKIISDENIRDLKYVQRVEVEDSEGYRGFISAAAINSGKGMSRFDVRINRKNYIYNVNWWASTHGANVECVGFCNDKEYQGGRVASLSFICECGNRFNTSIAAFQNGKTRCSVCAKSVSRFEDMFEKFLQELNVKYVRQYSLNQCRDILPLPFDFYIADSGILVEIDGQGHYKPCCFNHISFDRAQKTFESTKKHDKIKDAYCKENNIPLVRIPYYLFDKDDSYKTFFQESLRGLASSGK